MTKGHRRLTDHQNSKSKVPKFCIHIPYSHSEYLSRIGYPDPHILNADPKSPKFVIPIPNPNPESRNLEIQAQILIPNLEICNFNEIWSGWSKI